MKKNAASLFLGIFSLALAHCAQAPSTADTTRPAIADPIPVIEAGTDAAHELDISWTAASDTVTAAADLEYKLVYSTADNIYDMDVIEANGIVVHDFTANLLAATITGLDPSTQYYVNVVVRDEAGNERAYTTASALTGGCFTAGTQITLANGNTRAIEQMQPGDLVRSFDDAGELSTSTLGRLLVSRAQGFLRIVTDHGSVNATASHPFYAGAARGFLPIGEIGLGEAIYFDSGPGIAPTTLREKQTVAAETVVYNLHIAEGPPTYFANGFAVHNK